MAQFPSTTSAYGVWTLQDVRDAVRGNNWPSAPIPAAPDPNFNQVSLLLNGDGPDGGQNNTYTDSSVNDLTLSATSDITQGSFNPFGDNWSNYFDGTSGYLSIADDPSLEVGANDFTLECWLYNTGSSYSNAGIAGKWDVAAGLRSYAFYFDTSNRLAFAISSSGAFQSGNVITSTITASSLLNEWNHIRACKSGTTTYLFLNGISVGSTTVDSTVFNGTQNFYVGKINTDLIEGYVSNVRLINGTALSTSNFTPPTEPLTAVAGTSLLTCQSYGFKDASTNDFTITVNGTPKVTKFSPFATSEAYDAESLGGSAYFPNTTTGATGHQFSTPATADLDIGSGDFTIECFYYPTSVQNYSRVLWFNETWANNNAAGINYNTQTGKLSFNAYTLSNPVTETDNAMSLFCWYHVAVTRTGNDFAMYVDGVKQATTSTTSNDIFPTSTPTLYVANGPTSVGGYSPLQGWVANARVVKGTAVYSDDFTPPTSPVTAVSGTAALIDFADAAIPDYSTINNLNTVGNADISTAVVKYGTGSLAFDGTGDYLETHNKPDANDLGDGDFTIELWFKSSNGSLNTHACLVASYSSPVAGSWAFKASSGSTGYIQWAWYGPSWNDQVSTTNVASDEQWHHCAVTRNNGNMDIWVDGVSVKSWTTTYDFNGGGHPLTVGFMAQDSTSYINGYIDDLRITKGLARYTSTFTPPTEALPTF